MSATRLVIVADDLTGAAEIAGIAAGAGITAALRRIPGIPPAAASTSCLAYDTDSRLVPEQESIARVTSFAAHWPQADLLYKKTDSVLRGHIAAEIAVLLRATGKRRALLVPQNPSKSRVIINGNYAIAGIPLDQTDFARDPDHPCRSACVCATLANAWLPVTCLRPGEPMPEDGIIVGSAASSAEVAHWARHVDTTTLAAGGADFFHALLATAAFAHTPQSRTLPEGPRLIVCGSPAAGSRETVQQWQHERLPVHVLPEAATTAPHFDGPLLEHVRQSLVQHQLGILAATHDVIADQAPTLRRRMATLAASLVNQCDIRALLIEGGATAAALVDALSWTEFKVAGNLAPGVVIMHPSARPGIHLVIKPGSYPWPNDLLPSRD